MSWKSLFLTCFSLRQDLGGICCLFWHCPDLLLRDELPRCCQFCSGAGVKWETHSSRMGAGSAGTRSGDK